MRKTLTNLFAAVILSTSLLANADPVQCLTKAIYFEARGEPVHCQEKVAHVVLNRVNHSRFHNSVCGVIYARGQFSWVGSRDSMSNPTARARARDIAARIHAEHLMGIRRDTTSGALFFSTGHHFRGTRRVDRCSNHVFFRFA